SQHGDRAWAPAVSLRRFSMGIFTRLADGDGLPCYLGDWGRRSIRIPIHRCGSRTATNETVYPAEVVCRLLESCLPCCAASSVSKVPRREVNRWCQGRGEKPESGPSTRVAIAVGVSSASEVSSPSVGVGCVTAATSVLAPATSSPHRHAADTASRP